MGGVGSESPVALTTVAGIALVRDGASVGAATVSSRSVHPLLNQVASAIRQVNNKYERLRCMSVCLLSLHP